MKSIIWEKILSKKLRVLGMYKEIFKSELSEFGKSSSTYGKFGAFYELYLYAFAIGYFSNRRCKKIDDDPQTFNMISEWKSGHQTIFKNFFSALISNKALSEEAGFDLLTLSEMNDKELDIPIRNMIQIFEEYANGGFEILNEMLEENSEVFSHFMSLQKVHNEILSKNIYATQSGSEE